MQTVYFSLLQKWCDALIACQAHDLGPAFDGAFLCPACKFPHGRCQDAVYPLLYVARRTGENRYIEAAKAVFDWHDRNMTCDDGGVYNDAMSDWRYITVFAAVAVCEALERHGDLLDLPTREKWRAKLTRMADWLYRNLDEHSKTNINYVATNACAMALTGRFLNRPEYVAKARRLAAFALDYFTENGLLFGEGKPRDSFTPRRCRPIDIGYNVEESIPALIKYAVSVGDENALSFLTEVLRKQLDFLLPDGGWDNSFGSRNNKWTYYGSRTSDGCQAGYALLADRDPRFAEAALRNARLMERCSQNGLLNGGVRYPENGEPACVHHTFTHANALACALEAGIEKYTQPAALPADHAAKPISYYPEIDTYKLAVGDLRATITGYDYDLSAGHASGGTLTLLWHKAVGPVIVSSVVDYRLVEPVNQQQTLRLSRHRTLTPRVELIRDGRRYSQCYDTRASIEVSGDSGEIRVVVGAALVTLEQQILPAPVTVNLEYRFTAGGVRISGRLVGDGASAARFVLPIVSRNVQVRTDCVCEKQPIFFLTPGFDALEYTLRPDAEGHFQAEIRLPELRSL